MGMVVVCRRELRKKKTGRFSDIRLIGDVRIEKGCLVLGGNGLR